MGLSLKRVADPTYADLDWQAELEESDASFEFEDEDEIQENAFDSEEE